MLDSLAFPGISAVTAMLGLPEPRARATDGAAITHATLFTAMGISPTTVYDVANRAFYATEDGKGKSVEAVFA